MKKIVNRAELNKIDTFKPHAFEIIRFTNSEVVCVAYITTNEQWQRFLNEYKGEKIWVNSVDEETNTAVMTIV